MANTAHFSHHLSCGFDKRPLNAMKIAIVRNWRQHESVGRHDPDGDHHQ